MYWWEMLQGGLREVSYINADGSVQVVETWRH